MNHNILLFIERSIVTKRLRIVRFGIFIKENEHLEIIDHICKLFKKNEKFAITLNLLDIDYN